ncbi:MAG: hypothetical protein Q9196_007444, partial [Gyalolechia fulgens]
MGIRRLAGHLQPYSVSSILGSNPDTISVNDDAEARIPSSNVIVDGPGLAYHIYYKILAAKPSSVNAFNAQPSYADIGEALLAYLDLFEKNGLVITHIFFDGALPEYKRPIRISRLESSLKDLIQLHSLHPNGLPISFSHSSTQSTSLPESLFTSSNFLGSARLHPAPPFLVPAMLDTLAKTKYASLTSIVPGEADPYCARIAKDEGGITLTGDSDLLVYDTGPQGSVAFFNQIELCPANPKAENSGPVLRANIFHAHSLAARLNLPNLHRLAYEIKTDDTISFSEALRRARQDVRDPSLLQGFVEEYILPPASPSPKPPGPIPHFVDPRLSELVHQLTSPSLYNNKEPQMSLPFLIDDPSR